MGIPGNRYTRGRVDIPVGRYTKGWVWPGIPTPWYWYLVMATKSGGIHPTGMLSCLWFVSWQLLGQHTYLRVLLKLLLISLHTLSVCAGWQCIIRVTVQCGVAALLLKNNQGNEQLPLHTNDNREAVFLPLGSHFDLSYALELIQRGMPHILLNMQRLHFTIQSDLS